MIRRARSEDRPGITAVVEASGLFQAHELLGMEELLDDYFTGDPARDDFWVIDDEPGLVGAAYCAREQMTDQTWNLLFIAVQPDRRGQGRGAALISDVERTLTAAGQRLLLVETSGLDTFERTRGFYRRLGYEEEARIRDYYRAGDDKVVFRKALGPP